MIRLSICTFLFFVFNSFFLYSQNEDKQDYLKIGGALRFNTAIENYEESNKDLDTYIKMDTWFLSVDGRKDGFDLSFQYRFYPESKTHFLHHGYIGYTVDENLYLKLGVFQKPLGIANFASHSWWFQMPYYMGLEDTYNTGIGATYKYKKLTLDLAYFRQAAPCGSVSSNSEDNSVGNGRYSYAVVPTYGFNNGEKLDANIRELDQINARIRYKLTNEIELGLSGQLGSIYNRELDKRNWGITWAAHTLIDYGRWNFKGEAVRFDYNASANNGSKLDILQMAAYGSAYDVVTKGMIYVAGLSYTIPVNRKFIKSIQPYIDYSYVHKKKKEYYDTQFLIPGVMITSGPIYTYVDYAWGKNQPWLTSEFGVGLGEAKDDARWNSRLNINIGYYF